MLRKFVRVVVEGLRSRMIKRIEPRWIKFIQHDNPTFYSNIQIQAEQTGRERRFPLMFAGLSRAQKAMQNFAKQVPIFSPFSTPKLVWDIVTLLSLMYLMIFLPIMSGFSIGSAQICNQTIFVICYVVLNIDALVNMNTGTYENGVITNSRKVIVQNYLSRSLLTDIIGNVCIDFHALYKLQNNSRAPEHIYRISEPYQIEDLILIFYLLKIAQIQKLFQRLEER